MAAPTNGPAGFHPLLVKLNENSEASHTLFCKAYKSERRHEERPHNRTLVVINVPSYCTEECLRRIFSKFGNVDNVATQKREDKDRTDDVSRVKIGDMSAEDLKNFPDEKPEGTRVAYVVFANPKSVTKVKSGRKINKAITLTMPDKPIDTGMKKWVKEYSSKYPNSKKLQANVDAYMTKYDAAVEKQEAEERENEDVPDEDGWIKVTRKGKNPVVPRTEANEIKARAREKRRKRQRELLNVYSYQIRESKREKIAELRRKFEEDKERVKTMRDARKFRPF